MASRSRFVAIRLPRTLLCEPNPHSLCLPTRRLSQQQHSPANLIAMNSNTALAAIWSVEAVPRCVRSLYPPRRAIWSLQLVQRSGVERARADAAVEPMRMGEAVRMSKERVGEKSGKAG